MREIQIPEPIALKVPQVDGTERVIEQYTVGMYMDEYVMNQPEWRQSQEWFEASERIIEAYDDALAAGRKSYVVSDFDFEKLVPMFTLKGKQVAPPFVRAFNRLQRCMFTAKLLKAPPEADTPKAIPVKEVA